MTFHSNITPKSIGSDDIMNLVSNKNSLATVSKYKYAPVSLVFFNSI